MKSNTLYNNQNHTDEKKMCTTSKEGCIVHVAAESAPFSKRGGLGDVVGSLPIYISEESEMTNVVFTPYYSNMQGNFSIEFSGQFDFNGINYSYKILGANMGNVKYYFVDAEDTYSFDNVYIDGNKPYQTDVGLHYFILGKCIIYFLRELKVKVHSVITHDWHSAGIYPYIKLLEDYQCSRVNSIHIVHNYHHQGELFYDISEYLEDDLAVKILEQYEKIGWCSMNTIAIMEANHIVAVSPSYAKELNEKVAPHAGLEVLDFRKDRVVGILNGIDTKLWNPENDSYIVKPFSYKTIEYKYENKKHILEKLKLMPDMDMPLLAYMCRLTPQKGIDLFVDMKNGISIDIYERMERLLSKGATLVICGVPADGLNGSINNQLCKLQDKFKSNFRYISFYTEEIAHQLFAGSDIFLQPSRFEPCGLTQMYAMNYGSIPIVTPVGGLKDTVLDISLDSEKGNGFYMSEFSFEALETAIDRAVNIYRNKEMWNKLILRCMIKDFSWQKSIKSYIKLIDSCS